MKDLDEFMAISPQKSCLSQGSKIFKYKTIKQKNYIFSKMKKEKTNLFSPLTNLIKVNENR